ncbi:FMN-dependent alpha-hydroxy acid dehydrogenase [Lachnoclostridium phytofermentans ISDg]|uniref:L-lactate oxidase n=2 Tax=Lachnoclostridium phytofermentans TaxID=66219 RepID=A9KK46_LACP7|nr:alpha-hydroxy-acid oxidizing protein [Lachnoclostridium phytofermentans]ABX42618.1 FMN-dependent alpha-hydroxy acid dehydrogenase [Lachnoclostridium phytofermentans ISDg]
MNTTMSYTEIIENAKKNIGPYCKACPECNGRACRNQIPGPGAKGIGDTAIRNYDKWKEIRLNMDTLVAASNIDTKRTIYGKEFAYPFFAGPVGAISLHYGDSYNDLTYNEVLVKACADAGIAAFTGDGVNPEVMKAATDCIKLVDGVGVPTVKPWNLNTIKEKSQLIKDCNAFAVAMDVDAAGLPFLKNMQPPAGRKSVEELREIIQQINRPFIVKGVMTVKGAEKAFEAGASGILVSNHGGRVLDQCPSTAEVLEEIAKEFKGKMTIFVDGGIRSGADLFKSLALGADAAIIARPFVTAVFGGGYEGVRSYIQKIGAELIDVMEMCGVSSLDEITSECIWKK